MARIRMGLVPGLLLALGLAVAGCGGGGGKSNGVASLDGAGGSKAGGSKAGGSKAGGSQVDRQQALDWARCMRQHGIDLPDPQFVGDNIGQRLPNRAVRNSATFKAAEQACKQYEPNGGQPDPQADAQERQQALAFARCMRQHGITTMPDPQITANGIEQQLPERMDADDPRLKAAEQACHQYGSLPPAKPGGSPSGGGGK